MEQDPETEKETLMSSYIEKRQHVPYKNGVADLLISRPESINKSVSSIKDNILTKTVESVILGLECEKPARREEVGDSQVSSRHSSVLPDHASQLLKAAASVVSNNFKMTDASFSNTVAPLPTATPPDGVPLSETVSKSQYLGHSKTCSTTVSFMSRPSMSTGFGMESSYPLPTNVSSLLSSSTSSLLKVDSTCKYDYTKQILVPFLWRRLCENGVVAYYSPSSTKLCSLAEVKKYLLSEETCKCGLTCPFHVEKVFNFDPSFHSKNWSMDDVDVLNEPTSLSCCHRKHIKSHAIALQCRNNAKSVKPSPTKRKGKIGSSKRLSCKSPDMSHSQLVNNASNEQDKSAITSMPINTKAILNPLPPVEVVASQLRGTRSDIMSSQTFSPNHVNPGLSPNLMSPNHETLMGGSYGVPPGPPMAKRMMSGPQAYPMAKMMSYPIHRHPSEPGFGPAPPGYYPHHMGGPHGFPVGLAHPYHSQQGYEYGSGPHPHWGPQPHVMAPPLGAQFGTPMWQAKPDVSKRKRRASSKSSTAGSDTALGSPAMPSPGPSKTTDKRDLLNPLSKNSVSAVSSPSTEPSEPAQTLDSNLQSSSPASHSDTLPTTTSKAKDEEQVTSSTAHTDADRHTDRDNTKSSISKSDSVNAENQPKMSATSKPSVIANVNRQVMRPPNPYDVPNGIPIGAYMEPIYMPRQSHPNFRPRHPHMMYSPPHFYQQQPVMYPPQGYQQPIPRPGMVPPYPGAAHKPIPMSGEMVRSIPEHVQQPNADQLEIKAETPKSDNSNDKNSEKEGNSEEVAKPVQKLPDISTIAPGPSSHLPKLPSANGLRQPYTVPSYHPPQPMPPREMVRNPHPAQMMPAPNGHMYYQYYDPHLQPNQHPMPVYYHHPPNHPMYHPQQVPSQVPSNYQYNQQMSPTTSPKRKRRKAVTKTSIESHSALLVCPSNSESSEPTHKSTENGQPSGTNVSPVNTDCKKSSESTVTSMQSDT